MQKYRFATYIAVRAETLACAVLFLFCARAAAFGQSTVVATLGPVTSSDGAPAANAAMKIAKETHSIVSGKSAH